MLFFFSSILCFYPSDTKPNAAWSEVPAARCAAAVAVSSVTVLRADPDPGSLGIYIALVSSVLPPVLLLR